MNDLVKSVDGAAWVSSKALSDKFGKVHSKVLIDIKKLHCSEGFRDANFRPSSFTTSQNKVLPHYEITRNGFAFLRMGWPGAKAGQW